MMLSYGGLLACLLLSYPIDATTQLPSPTLWTPPFESATSTSPSMNHHHDSIWKVDYNEMVQKDAAKGWQGLGYVFVLNTMMFLIAFFTFTRYAHSSRSSLYQYRKNPSDPFPPSFTIRKWMDLLWKTPLQGTEIETRLGPEGTFYLVYQVYTMRFLLCLSIYACMILIPFYLSVGTQPSSIHSNATITPPWSFAHTTIRAIPNDSIYMWIPVLTCYLFTMVFMYFCYQLSSLCSIPHQREHSETDSTGSCCFSLHQTTPLAGMQPSALSLRSLFVDRGFPKSLNEERCMYLLHILFPQYIDDVCIVYNLSEFYSYQETRIQKENNVLRIQQGWNQRSWSLWFCPGSMKYPNLYYIIRQWCCCILPFNTNKLTQAKAKITMLQQAEESALERIIRQNKGAGRAFLIFKSPRLRARFVHRVRNASVQSIVERFASNPSSDLTRLKRYVRELGLTHWHLSTAPESDDIDWVSVSSPFVTRTVMVISVNILILILLFVFTSPVAVTSALSSSSSYSTHAAQSISDWMMHLLTRLQQYSPLFANLMISYLPTLILVLINAVLLNGLQIAGRIQPMATDSSKERMILRTSVVYLIFNTIFVPSFAFVSLDAVFLYLQTKGHVLDLLGTLFLHNSGIFYVNYVLQRCFLGTSVHLLRASEYVKFMWEKPRALTSQEHASAVEAWPFFTGTMTAIQISMLTIVLTFSTVVPLILPIGCIYFIMQHAVDKYALLYVRPKIQGRGSIARTATHATLFSILIYQGAMCGFFLLRGTTIQSSSVFILFMLTYIISLWWYIRDKERAAEQTSRGHHVHGPHCKKHKNRKKKKEKNPLHVVSSVVQEFGMKGDEPSSNVGMSRDLEAAIQTSGERESDLYRAPPLRRGTTMRLATRTSLYGAVDQRRTSLAPVSMRRGTLRIPASNPT